MSDALRFFLRFLKAPSSVGAIAPSSRALARTITRHLRFDPGSLVVELGPGTGAFTNQIAPNVQDERGYLGIELEESFVTILRARHPHLHFVRDSAEHLRAILDREELGPPTDILSGLPFASLPAAMTTRILQEIRTSLAPGGSFATFQYVQAYPLRKARAFRAQMRELFGAEPERSTVWFNLLPAYVLRWTTKA